MTRMRWNSTAITALFLLAAPVASAAPSGNGAPQGGTWQSIMQLPDWSGVWRNTSYTRNMVAHGRAPYKNLDKEVPWNPTGAARFAEMARLDEEGKPRPIDRPNCMTRGMPGELEKIWSAQMMLFTPGLVTIVQADGTRLIYTDGRPHPADNTASYQGHSIGHWEPGGVLVVDTVDLEPSNPLVSPIAMGKNVHVAERIYRKNDNLYQEVTVEAPALLRAPWKFTAEYKKSDSPLKFYECPPANDRATSTGALSSFDLTPPPEGYIPPDLPK